MASTSYQPDPKILEVAHFMADPVNPANFPLAKLRYRNVAAAKSIGLDELDAQQWQRHFWAFEAMPENLQHPLALRYHGHQFLHYNPELGDGRGFLFAQLRDDQGRLLDLGTKGSGTTPYSRRGDGRLTLQGGVREVLAAAMLQARGVCTSRALSLFETGEALQRGDEPSPTRSAVLVRLSHSHLRVGSFERLAHLGLTEDMRKLLSHVVQHYHDANRADEDPSTLAPWFLAKLCRQSAQMVAQWTFAGFVHGVLNTDNINLTGESFDYGPFRFLDHFDPDRVAAYFDQQGLYAFGRQGEMVGFSMRKLAQALSLVSPTAALQEALDAYSPHFARALARTACARLGRQPAHEDKEALLAQALLAFLRHTTVSMEGVFFDHFAAMPDDPRVRSSPRANHYEGPHYRTFADQLRDHEPMPLADHQRTQFERRQPCELVHDEVVAIWDNIAQDDDWSSFCQKLTDIDNVGHAYGLASAQRGSSSTS